MLKEQSQFLQRSLFFADLLLIALGWLIAYGIRFGLLHPASPYALDGLIAALPLVNDPTPRALSEYLTFLPGVLVLWGAVFLLSGLYRTRRATRLPLVVYSVARAVALGIVASLAALFFYRAFSFSRVHMLLFGVTTAGLLVGLRLTIYTVLRRARQQGKNLRRVLIVGAGKAGQRLARAFRQYPWMGFEVLGFVDDRAEVFEEPPPGRLIHDHVPRRLDTLGHVDDLADVMDRLGEAGQHVDLVYVALPLRATHKIEPIAEACSKRTAHMCLVPDLFHLGLLVNSRVSDVDGLPVIHLMDEAPFDGRQVIKRGLDIAFSAAVLVLLAPLFLLLALGVKLSSPGPVFYRQTRMGLNGQTFEMLKFRSMPTNAESKTGAVWAKSGENRATPFGSFLRKTSLDELPQFLNVLRGDMSVVGPRPERPVF
ncbi:MAG: exopolysaccharide biosynthesis polyprenyl glycosylphosphotransferase, partial [Bacteroidota bacterium]